MNWKRIKRKLIDCGQVLNATARVSYSQVGEDLIAQYLFQSLKIQQPTYLEVGTNHPIIGNNTYFFYLRGCVGVCVEPDPNLFSVIRLKRPQDKLLNCGIGLQGTSSADFFSFPPPYTGWNTFSKKEAEKRQAETGIQIEKVVHVPLITINEVMEKYFNPYPNFLSLDVEGLDFDILQSIDFDRFRPDAICVESVTFQLDGRGEKISSISSFMESKDYFTYADTFVNTIFCRKDKFDK